MNIVKDLKEGKTRIITKGELNMLIEDFGIMISMLDMKMTASGRFKIKLGNGGYYDDDEPAETD